MTECCNSYGKCTQGFNCPAREKSRSEFTANQLLFKPEAPIQYMPKYDEPPMGYVNDVFAMIAIWVVGVILGAVGLLYFLTWWNL